MQGSGMSAKRRRMRKFVEHEKLDWIGDFWIAEKMKPLNTI